jgi:Rne/Rng family ribonuclease
MRKQVLINVEETDIRVAVLEDGNLAELFVEDLQARSKVGNIYKGRVESIVPGLKAVFVNIGLEKNAFLHFADVLPEYDLPERGAPERDRRSRAQVAAANLEAEEENEESLEGELEDEFQEPGNVEGEDKVTVQRPPRRSRPLRVGDEILVQVTKEEINTKGARITTYVSLPGRYLVLMPFSENGGGVSRRIEKIEERRRLRDLLRSIKPEQGGYIIRTAGLEEDEDAIRKDADLLQRQWAQIVKRTAKVRAPQRVHDDQEIITRVVRDNFSEDIDEILVDQKAAMRELIKACEAMTPDLCPRINFFDSPQNIFDVFEVEKQFQKALERKVWLKSGGAIIIDETEALIAIDVNSGKYVGHGDDQETVILKTNLEACRVVARQLRLRDLGGLIVIDFIDMNHRSNEVQVLKELKRCLRADRAKYTLTDFSEFGLVEMTRKRVRRSLATSLTRPCPYCMGTSRIMNENQLWKKLKYELIAELEQEPKATSVDILVHSQFKTYLQTAVIAGLQALAGKYQIALNITGQNDVHHESVTITKNSSEKTYVKSEGGPRIAPRALLTPEKKLETPWVGQHNAS